MDSYAENEEIGYSPRESEDLLKRLAPGSPKINEQRRNTSRIFILAGIALVGCVELIFFLVLLVHGGGRNQMPSLLGELNGLVPEFRPQPVLFRPDPLATSDHTTVDSINATEENWLKYMPRGNGFIILNDGENYQLPPPIEKSGEHVYSLAVTHQLHCLYSIMRTFDDLIDGEQSSSGRNAHKHIDHCFRYLRQSLLCCGDTAFEGQDLNTTLPSTDGTGAIHMCKDYDAILRWAEGQSVTNKKHM